MERVYLVQRLRKPVKGLLASLANPFGGGFKNGGLSDEAMSLINDIFLFDYMGSAEFEWGAVPKALARIYDDKSNISFEIVVETKEKKSGVVYVICNQIISKDVEEWIKNKGFNEYDRNYRTKEVVGLQGVINNEQSTRRVCGWLELDNGFFFFTDKEMFEKTKKLFGVN